MFEVSSVNNVVYPAKIIHRTQGPKSPAVTPMHQNVDCNGLDALAAYNFNFINRNNGFNIPTVKPINIPEDLAAFKGKHIYNSSGELVAVMKETSDNKYIYYNNENKLIEVYNKVTGEKIKQQDVFMTAAGDMILSVINFMENNNQSFYKMEHNKLTLLSKSKSLINKDCSIKEYIYYADTGEYQVIESSGLGYSMVYYDKNKNLKNIVEHGESYNLNQEIMYKNGIPFALEENKKIAIKNKLAQEPMLDPDLFPANKFDKDIDFEKIKGEKLYYSNGTIEKIVSDEGTYYFDVQGNLSKFEGANLSVKFEDSGQSITEYFDGGGKKITDYSDNGKQILISYEKDNFCKRLCIEKGKPSSYDETLNGKGWCALYAKDGSLLEIAELANVNKVYGLGKT